jgi:lipid II:glycine glycyltransferase (peptidoglycan interpeptide bridge formation enzyme)
VEVKISDSLDSVKDFYRLNCVTRKRHGLPPQPFYFFENIYNHIISQNKGIVGLASYQKNIIAGAIYFHFGEKAVYKYGAWDRTHQQLRPNNLIMWRAIEWYARNGYRYLSFGRTELEDQGLIQFKSGWGTTEEQINYYRYDLKKGSFVSGSSKVTGFHNKIFRNIPIPILKKVGSILYKHIG